MQHAQDIIAAGKRHHQAGDLEAAERCYRQVLDGDPQHVEALYFTGILCQQLGRFDEAVQALERATRLNERAAVLHYALGNAFLAAGRLEEAAPRFRRAIKFQPTLVEAHNNLGVALEQAGKLDDAVRALREAHRLKPDAVDVLVNLGNALRKLDELDEARVCLEKAIALNPSIPEAHNNLGNILRQLGESASAKAHLETAVRLRPNYAEAWNNLGTLYKDLDQHAEAIRHFREACMLAPADASLHYNLGVALREENKLAEADAAFAGALEIDPRYAAARFQKTMLFPVIYDSAAEIDAWRARYIAGLDELIALTPLKTDAGVDAAARGLGSVTTFYLGYQCRNDRALQEKFGTFAHEIMSRKFPQWARQKRMPKRSGNQPIRVGYVSSYFRYHSGGRLTLGFLRHADLKQFRTYCYFTDQRGDHVTDEFRTAASRFHHLPGSAESVAKQIESDKLHVLVITDVGMEPKMTQLAALRLAPVQMTTWVHPVTTGIPTVDYFITSELMEPATPEGDEHYTEKLVRLPGIGVCYDRPKFPESGKVRGEFGLRDDDIAYLSCQSLYKYLPQHDRLFAEIATHVPNARFVFLSSRSRNVTEQFRRRVLRAFSEAELDGEAHVLVLPRLDAHGDYLRLHQVCDIALDTIGWSGGNTTLESLAAGLPVVTLPGEFMRGRHAYAMLRTLEMDGLIAGSEAEYVAIASRLGIEVAWRREQRRLIEVRADRLFDDVRPVRALEAFFRSVVDGNDASR
jgi:protein O-GlcNAc transferase